MPVSVYGPLRLTTTYVSGRAGHHAAFLFLLLGRPGNHLRLHVNACDTSRISSRSRRAVMMRAISFFTCEMRWWFLILRVAI